MRLDTDMKGIQNYHLIKILSKIIRVVGKKKQRLSLKEGNWRLRIKEWKEKEKLEIKGKVRMRKALE